MTGLTTDDKIALIVSVGRGGQGGTRKLSPVEVASLLQKCIEAGDAIPTLSKELQIGADMIKRFVSILRLSDTTKALIDWGSSHTSISFTSAYAIARLKSADDQEKLARAVVEYGFTKEDALQAVQRASRSNLGVDEAISRILELRPTYIKTYLIIGAIDPENWLDLKEKSPPERDEVLLLVLENLIGEKLVGSARVGAQRFTLSLDERQNAKLIELKPDFETAVNTDLRMVLNAK